MAKRIVDEEMRFSIIINGDKAQKELYDLEKNTKELTKTNKELRKERAALASQGKRNTSEYKALSASIKQNSATLESNKARMEVLQKQIGLTGLTMAQLRKRAARLRIQLNNMVPGSNLYNRLNADLKAVNARLTQLSSGARATEGALSRLANGFNKYQALALGVVATITGLVLSGQKLIDFNSKLSDSQSDVRKTTGLSKAAVDDLTKSFGLFKTRTARIELLKLAETAGRLGITGAENIKAFVKQANKLKVALGDDLNEKQIKSVGKMVEVYDIATKTGKDYAGALDALGSAINEVSASGSNEAGYLVDYMARLGGVSKNAKIAATDNIGYAATFNELELQVETSATAMNKVWTDMFKNTEFYANIAGVGIKDFSTLLETDANAAMIKFLKGLNNGNAGFGSMLEKMEELDAGGSRGETALLSLAAATDKLEARQKTANEALEKATSLTDEYNIKNNNLAGSLQKVQKWIIGVFTSETVVKWLSESVEWFAKFIGASHDADGSVGRFKQNLIGFIKTLAILTAAVLSYQAAVKLATLWTVRQEAALRVLIIAERVHIFLTNAAKGATLLLSAAYNLVTGNITRATAAMRLFNTVTKLNPIGLLIGFLAAAATAYFILKNETKAATTAQLAYAKAADKAVDATRDSVTSIRTLQKVAEDETQSQEARLDAIKKINEVIPDYNKDLDLTAEALEKGRGEVDKYVDSLLKQAQAQALLDLVIQKSKELEQTKQSSADDYITWLDRFGQTFETVMSAGLLVNDVEERANEKKRERISLLEKEKQAAEDALRLFNTPRQGPQQQGAALPILPPFTDGFVPGPKTDAPPTGSPLPTKPKTTGKSPRLFNLEKEREETARIIRANQALRADLLDEGFKKELEQLDLQHAEKIARLEFEQTEIAREAAEVFKKAADARAAGDDTTADNYTAQGEILIEQHIALNDQLHQLDFIHHREVGLLLAEAIDNKLDQIVESFESEQALKEIAHNEALADLGTNEAAKKRLQDSYDKQKLVDSKAHLKSLVSQAEEILNSTEFEGVNLDLLSDAETAALKKRLEEVGLSLSEINALLASIRGGVVNEGAGLEGLGDGASTDIFGMSIDDWELAYANMDELESKLQMITASVRGLQEIWGAYYQYLDAKEQREFNQFEKNNTAKQQKLKRRLDSGLINERQYEQGLASLQREADRKKAELEYNAAMRKYRLDMAQAVGNTAMAVINGLNTTPFFPLGIAMAALAGILGGFQIATIANNKPVRGFESGFMGSLLNVTREQDGKQFSAAYGGESRSGIVDKPTVFLAGEQGKNFPELIVSGPDLKRMDPRVVDSLKSELGRVKGFENGFTGNSFTSSESGDGSSGTDMVEMMQSMMSLISDNTTVLEELKEKGVQAYQVRSLEEAAKTQEDLDKLRSFKDKAKITS